MLTFDSIPQARVVRKGGQQFAPPPAPKSDEPGRLYEVLSLLVGLWPLTAVVLLATGFLILGGKMAAP